MSKPKRIQKLRAKGWRMPSGAIYVGSPTKWGNPFVIGVDGDREACVELFIHLVDNGLLCISAAKESVSAQNALMDVVTNDIEELHGHDLACWCPLDSPCHADVLLEIANS